MAHQFDSSNKSRLNSEERKRLLAPSETLSKLGYRKYNVMADIGCGTGLFTLAAAEICAGESTVYAVDISEEMLREVEKSALEAGYPFIRTIKSEKYDFKLDNTSADFVLICTVLHEVEDKPRFLEEAARICRTGGKVSVIEFNETLTGFGPPLSHRVSKSEARSLLAEAGFHDFSELNIGESLYAVTAEK